MRAVHFIGIETLFHLMIGTYHRPVVEQKVLVFVDINNSTALAERLGALKIKSLVGKFLFDISKPLTDYGGEIYLYKGDGLIAIWAWTRRCATIEFCGRSTRSSPRSAASMIRYVEQFGVTPSFRIGVHGGDVVVSEQGDTKRSIGIYGSTINIASRMEEAAKAHGSPVRFRRCLQALIGRDERLHRIGFEKVKGISAEIPIFEYREAEPSSAPAPRRTARSSARRSP